MAKYIGHQGIKRPKFILVRANNIKQAILFSKGTINGYQPHKATLIKKYGLAGGVKMYKVSFKRNYGEGFTVKNIKYLKKS